MKRLLSLVPILVLMVFVALGPRLLASGQVSPLILMLIPLGMLFLVSVLRPKNGGAKPVSDLEKTARGEFAKDAFANDPALAEKFASAMKDFNSNMPKSALTKLTKLAPLCTGEKEIYAVSMATAQCQLINGKPLFAIREYNRALNIHPTPEVAMELGSCHQRLGSLDKARDSYEYALDLNPDCLEAYSRIATTYVADHEFKTALDYANQVLDRDETHASALATAAICHGLLNDPVLCKYYTQEAVNHGYNQKKIDETIDTLKRRVK